MAAAPAAPGKHSRRAGGALKKVNLLNAAVGVAGLVHVAIAVRFFMLSSGREHFGNTAISFITVVLALLPSFGVVLSLTGPERPFMGWRVPGLVLLGLLVGPQVLVWSYEG